MKSNNLLKIREKSQDFVINSDEFKSLLTNVASTIRDASNLAKSEADVVYAFDSNYITFIKDVLALDFTPSKEESVDTIKFSSCGRKNAKGRIDSRIGSVVIEFKHHSKLQTTTQKEKAIIQTFEYLHGLNKVDPGQYIGFVTDGVSCIIIRVDYGNEIRGSYKKLDGDSLHQLSCAILLLNKKSLSSDNLIDDFCNSDNSISIDLSRSLLNALDTHMTGRSKMLFMEWQELFRLAHDDKSKQQAILDRKKALEELAGHKLMTNEDEYKVLYALQTAYAIIVKIIAFKVISIRYDSQNDKFSEMQRYDSESIRQHLSKLEDGAIFRDYGIGNLLEGDFFSWYCTEDQWDESIYNCICNVFHVLTEYEDRALLKESSKVCDLFKDLYMKFIPDKVRHSLGEFYTPPWLAEHVVSETIKKTNINNWSALDPCCGSGTFITTLISKVLERKHENNTDKLNDILRSVKGIDLNPLAVLTARINYFINISDFIVDGDEIEIPIYLGDSSYVPVKVIVDDVSCLKYTINTLKGPLEIIIPESAVRDTSLFSKTMSDIEYSIKDLNTTAVYEKLISLCDPVDLTDLVKLNIKELSEKFIDLENQEWNGIWARIVTNFLTTANLGKFEIIVGNPPWIDWKSLPAGYRERVKKLCLDRNLFSGDRLTGGINLNICALISNVSVENWLSDDGVLAFLMPQNLIFQQTYEGFRNFNTKGGRLYLQEIFDWSKSGHPFQPVTVKFSTYFFSKKIMDYKEGVPLKHVKKRKGTPALNTFTKAFNFDEVSSIFDIEEAVIGTVHSENNIFSHATTKSDLQEYKKIVGNCLYKGREGIEFFPQELFLLEYIKNVGNKVEFTNFQNGTRSKYKISKQSILIETKFVHPLIKGTDIEPFNIKPTSFYVPFPYEEGSRKPLQINELTEQSKLLANYFRRNKSVLEQQTSYNDKIIGSSNLSAFYALARVGEYTYGEYFVCFRDNTKWQAAVAEKAITPWGEMKRPLFQNHAVSISQRQDGSFISKLEAHFICSILNAPIVKKYMENSSDSRSFKIRPPVNIPLFDDGNNAHIELAELSIKAHNKRRLGDNIDEIISRIDVILTSDMI